MKRVPRNVASGSVFSWTFLHFQEQFGKTISLIVVLNSDSNGAIIYRYPNLTVRKYRIICDVPFESRQKGNLVMKNIYLKMLAAPIVRML